MAEDEDEVAVEELSTPFCLCGCGQHVRTHTSKFVLGHALKTEGRNARALAQVGGEMTARCTCGWTMTGPTRKVLAAQMAHRKSNHPERKPQSQFDRTRARQGAIKLARASAKILT